VIDDWMIVESIGGLVDWTGGAPQSAIDSSIVDSPIVNQSINLQSPDLQCTISD
jgi:hypothetical protein